MKHVLASFTPQFIVYLLGIHEPFIGQLKIQRKSIQEDISDFTRIIATLVNT